MIDVGKISPMELAADTNSIKYSPTSTPILDGLRPLPGPNWLRLNASEYFFLSGIAILALIGLPLLRRVAEALGYLGFYSAIFVSCMLIPAAALLLGQAVHESGHIAAAWLAGFTRVKGDPQAFGERDLSICFLRVAAATLKPLKTDHLRARFLLVFAAGPAANFFFPAALEGIAWMNRWGGASVFFVHAFGSVSVLQGIADLLPDSGRGKFSDGSRMLMLLKNASCTQRWLSMTTMLLGLEHGDHPAAWDESRIQHLTGRNDETYDAVAARWLAYLWATERQDITCAAKFLEEALAASAFAGRLLRHRLFFEAALFQAWFRDDATKGRLWASRIRPKSVDALQQPRLVIALMWADGKLFDAWEKLCDYLRYIQGKPNSSAHVRADRQALEWKAQMESRMLTRAWRTIYSMSQQVGSLEETDTRVSV